MAKSRLYVLLGLCGCAAALGAYWLGSGGDDAPVVQQDPVNGEVLVPELERDAASGHFHGHAHTAEADDKRPRNPDGYGETPPVPLDANEQVKLLVESARNKTHPERFSSLILPKPFDHKAYEANPDEYLKTPEPGRVFQPAQPGEDVPRIRGLSPYFQTVAQGESISLRVQAIAGAPVTFTSFDLGRFENQLTTITVRANEEGVARTQFFGMSGTINDVNILAASPMTAGQVKFIAHVTLPPDDVPVLGDESAAATE